MFSSAFRPSCASFLLTIARVLLPRWKVPDGLIFSHAGLTETTIPGISPEFGAGELEGFQGIDIMNIITQRASRATPDRMHTLSIVILPASDATEIFTA
jgi:hypothetical protein